MEGGLPQKVREIDKSMGGPSVDLYVCPIDIAGKERESLRRVDRIITRTEKILTQ